MGYVYEPEVIELDKLLPLCKELKEDGWRVCQILSASLEENDELVYTFAKEYQTRNLQIFVDKGASVPSITQYFGYAFLYECEISELFGIKIEDISSGLDRNLYKLNTETPFKR